MDSDRWERAKEIFAAALEREEGDRLQVVADACEGDEALQREVESLLSAHNDAGEFMKSAGEHPAFDAPTSDNPPTTFSVGQVICGRYKVLRFIGRGGMGEVYEAKDLELGTRLALKTIRPEISARPGTVSRFRQEIKLARRVTHPNVCRIYDWEHYRPSGDNGESEITFITMELLEGETLAARLSRQGRMRTEEALPLVQQMADGLAAAHEAGVVHCDFKPGNVMLVPVGTSDVDSHQTTTSLPATPQSPAASEAPGPARPLRAVITDFGLSRAVAPSIGRDSAPPSLGGGGQIVGTPAYMAPEQLEGRKATPATDIYALGLVIYEMVTGHQPFPGDTYERLREPPPSPRVYVSDLDQHWELAILRCVERDLAARYTSAKQVVGAINSSPPATSGEDPSPAHARRAPWARHRVLAASLGGLVTLVAVAAILWYFNPPSWQRIIGPNLPDRKNLVVLPFQALDGRPDEQVRCDGFTDTVTTKLAQLDSVEVPAAASVRDLHVASIAKARTQFGATLVLVASCQQAGRSARINLSLVDAKTGGQLRADSVTAVSDDVFSLQDQVVLQASRMLELQLSPGNRKDLTTHGTGVLTAYDFYVQGLGYLQRYEKPENVDLAISLFQRAISEDTSYAQAQAALAQAYLYKYNATKDPQWAEQAKAAVKTAESLNSRLPDVQLAIGYLSQRTGAYAEAVEALNRTLELDPDNVEAYQHLGQVYDLLGRAPQAEQAFRRAISIRPACWSCYNELGIFLVNHNRFGEAAQAWQKVIELTPDNPWGYTNLGTIYLYLGEFDHAEDIFRRGLSLAPQDPNAAANAAAAAFYLGRFEEGVRYSKTAIALRPQEYSYWGNLADAYRLIPEESNKADSGYRQAIVLAEKQLEINPEDAQALSRLALYLARTGEPARAQHYLAAALKISPNDWDTLEVACLVHLAAGERREALKWLGLAVRAGYPRGMLVADPELASLRPDPQFAGLAKEAKTYR